MNDIIIHLNGKMVKRDFKTLHAMAPGILEGKGVFETMQVYSGKIFAFDQHWQRLLRGLKAYNIHPSFKETEVLNNIHSCLLRNELNNARVRLTIWRSSEKIKMSIVCQGVRRRSQAQYQKGFSVTLSKLIRNKTKYSHIKSIDYQLFRQAYLQAKKNGYDEAILLNRQGFLVEGTRTNIFYVKNRTLYTPSVQCGCLNGITRQFVLQIARRKKISYKTVKAKPNDVIVSDEAFLTNSLLGIMPVTRFAGKRIGKGRMGEVTFTLHDAYSNLVQSILAKI